MLGRELGVSGDDEVSRVVALIRKMGKMPDWPRVAPKMLIAAMVSDKKTREGKLRFVLSPRIGEAHSSEAVPKDALELVLQLMPKLLDRKAELRRSGNLHG